MRVPRADPLKPPSLPKRLLTPVALSDAGTWYLKKIAPRLDPPLARFTRGRFASIPLIPVCLLEHVGAKTGQRRVTPLVYFTDGDDVILMASNYGGARNPAWYHNLKANPEVTLQARGRRGRYLARETTGEERERLWELAKRHTRAYANYEVKAKGRTILVVASSP